MDENVADLRAVAVGDDDFVFAGEFGDKFTDFFSDGFLSLGRDFAVFLEGVAAEGDDDTFFNHILYTPFICLRV